MNLSNKTIIVTGANSGMGMATVAALSDLGATVVMLCRSEERGKKAYEELSLIPERRLDLMYCDLGDFESIHRFAERFKEKYKTLNVLINNAGFISLDRRETKEGLEQQFGVNHIGHFLLTLLLLPCMQAGGRIINVASGAHKVGKIHFDDINLTRGYNVVKAYSQSKLANILFTRELAERLKPYGITVNCCHPGAVATSMGVDRTTGFGKTITALLKPFFLTPEEGARTAVYLATSDCVEQKTGQYFYKCRVAKSSKASHRKRLAKQLFELSEDITKYKFHIS